MEKYPKDRAYGAKRERKIYLMAGGIFSCNLIKWRRAIVHGLQSHHVVRCRLIWKGKKKRLERFITCSRLAEAQEWSATSSLDETIQPVTGSDTLAECKVCWGPLSTLVTAARAAGVSSSSLVVLDPERKRLSRLAPVNLRNRPIWCWWPDMENSSDSTALLGGTNWWKWWNATLLTAERNRLKLIGLEWLCWARCRGWTGEDFTIGSDCIPRDTLSPSSTAAADWRTLNRMVLPTSRNFRRRTC